MLPGSFLILEWILPCPIAYQLRGLRQTIKKSMRLYDIQKYIKQPVHFH